LPPQSLIGRATILRSATPADHMELAVNDAGQKGRPILRAVGPALRERILFAGARRRFNWAQGSPPGA
jgi:hypothetical protein